MSTATKFNLVSVEDYLAFELLSPVKHEYVGGLLYPMIGARNAHNLIAGNALLALGAILRGKDCRPYNSDTKIRVQMRTHVCFYYPDVSVTCQPNPQSDSFQDKPALIVEVLSPKTNRTDGGEKKDAYLTIRVWSPWHRVISSETGLLPARSPLTWPFQNKDPFRK